MFALPDRLVMPLVKDWLSTIGKSAHHIEEVTIQVRLKQIFWWCYVRLTVKIREGLPTFDVTNVIQQENVGRATWLQYEAGAQELASGLSQCAFSRSRRLKGRSPGLAPHEWIATLERLGSCIRAIKNDKVEERRRQLEAQGSA